MLTKGVFIKLIYVFFYRSLRRINAHYPQVYWEIFLTIYSMSSSCVDIILEKGGGRHGHHDDVCVRTMVGSTIASRSLANFVK